MRGERKILHKKKENEKMYRQREGRETRRQSKRECKEGTDTKREKAGEKVIYEPCDILT